MPASSAAQSQASDSTAQTLSLLDEIIAKGRMAHDDSQQDYARDMLAEFATQVLDEGMAIDKDTVAMINDRISQIDELISAQLNEVLHHPDLQKLEASWRGLHMLVQNTETSTRLKLRLLNVTQKELQNDLEKKLSSSTRARCSRRSTKRNTAPSAATRSACWWVTTPSAGTRRTSACWRNSRTSPRLLTRRSLLPPALGCST